MLLTKMSVTTRRALQLVSIALSRAKRQRWGMIALAAWLLAACTSLPEPTPVAPPPTPAIDVSFAAQPAQQAIPALIWAERTAARSGNLALLEQLWAADGRVIDGRGNVDPSDDYRWPDRAAVLDRYIVAVFPNPPPLTALDALTLNVAGDQATAANGQDHWQFVHRMGRWWILELAYGRPPAR